MLGSRLLLMWFRLSVEVGLMALGGASVATLGTGRDAPWVVLLGAALGTAVYAQVLYPILHKET